MHGEGEKGIRRESRDPGSWKKLVVSDRTLLLFD